MLFGKPPAPGLVEYVTHWNRRKPLQVADLIEEVPLDPKASGALFLLQAGKMDQTYLDALQTLDWQELVEHRRYGVIRPAARCLIFLRRSMTFSPKSPSICNPMLF